jgi:hypothetical protein
LFCRPLLALAERCYSFRTMSWPVLHHGRSKSRPEVSELGCLQLRTLRYRRYGIIKRRVAWFIGKWISDECAPANDGRIWEILVHLLQARQSSTDMAVRLTAASALRMCINVSAIEWLTKQRRLSFTRPWHSTSRRSSVSFRSSYHSF